MSDDKARPFLNMSFPPPPVEDGWMEGFVAGCIAARSEPFAGVLAFPPGTMGWPTEDAQGRLRAGGFSVIRDGDGDLYWLEGTPMYLRLTTLDNDREGCWPPEDDDQGADR